MWVFSVHVGCTMQCTYLLHTLRRWLAPMPANFRRGTRKKSGTTSFLKEKRIELIPGRHCIFLYPRNPVQHGTLESAEATLCYMRLLSVPLSNAYARLLTWYTLMSCAIGTWSDSPLQIGRFQHVICLRVAPAPVAVQQPPRGGAHTR